MPDAPPPRRAFTRRQILLGGVGATALTCSSTAAYAGVEAANELKVTRYRLQPPNWPRGHRLTITVVADLHAGGPNMGLKRCEEVVEVANHQKSDLMVLLGDFEANHPFVTEVVPPAAWATVLARLKAPLGVWSILGNHDWWYGVGRIRGALQSAGIPVLENDAQLLGHPPHRFWLTGLGDQLAHRLRHGRFRGEDDLPGMLARVTTDDPVIMLVHEPDIFTRVPDRVALTLAGHTHGGQVRIPLIWPRFVPSRYGARFAYGHIVERDRHMLVSGGLGTSHIPARLGVPPEVVTIELS